MYLIDSDVIIYSLKGHAATVERMLQHRTDPKSISVITYGELVYGARKSQRVEKNLATVHHLAELFPLLPVTRSIMETFANLEAPLEKGGTRLDDMDLLIAATALVHNLTLVTNNERHFQRIEGLAIENWTS